MAVVRYLWVCSRGHYQEHPYERTAQLQYSRCTEPMVRVRTERGTATSHLAKGPCGCGLKRVRSRVLQAAYTLGGLVAAVEIVATRK